VLTFVLFLTGSLRTLSYSKIMEFETALAEQVKLIEGLLPSNVSPIGNVCWDNFDLREETPSGSGTTHSCHGIVVQEVCNGYDLPNELPSITRTGKRSIDCSQTFNSNSSIRL